ncbi:MAG: thiamine diphosphokinase [bacterium]|nr:thiamine diphosphokinase [bacterium]
MQSKRALIVLGGEFPPPDWLKSLHHPDDIVIAADRGALLCEAAQLPLSVLVGDFDSLDSADSLTYARPQEIERFPTDKDFSDGELALLCAQRRGCPNAVLVAALGGRLDHCLFNIVALLEKAEQLGLTAEIAAPETAIFQLAEGQRHQLSYAANSWCSLISLDRRSTVSLQGLLYSGDAIMLERASTRGLSNVILDPSSASIRVTEGQLLVIVSSRDISPSHPLGGVR